MVETTGSFPAALPGGSGKGSKMDKMSPRKQMAMGAKMPSASDYPTDGFPGTGHVMHPDASMDTSKTMNDNNRGMSSPVGGGGAGRMSMPGAVDHGPHNHTSARK